MLDQKTKNIFQTPQGTVVTLDEGQTWWYLIFFKIPPILWIFSTNLSQKAFSWKIGSISFKYCSTKWWQWQSRMMSPETLHCVFSCNTQPISWDKFDGICSTLAVISTCILLQLLVLNPGIIFAQRKEKFCQSGYSLMF